MLTKMFKIPIIIVWEIYSIQSQYNPAIQLKLHIVLNVVRAGDIYALVNWVIIGSGTGCYVIGDMPSTETILDYRE